MLKGDGKLKDNSGLHGVWKKLNKMIKSDKKTKKMGKNDWKGRNVGKFEERYTNCRRTIEKLKKGKKHKSWRRIVAK